VGSTLLLTCQVTVPDNGEEQIDYNLEWTALIDGVRRNIDNRTGRLVLLMHATSLWRTGHVNLLRVYVNYTNQLAYCCGQVQNAYTYLRQRRVVRFFCVSVKKDNSGCSPTGFSNVFTADTSWDNIIHAFIHSRPFIITMTKRIVFSEHREIRYGRIVNTVVCITYEQQQRRCD